MLLPLIGRARPQLCGGHWAKYGREVHSDETEWTDRCPCTSGEFLMSSFVISISHSRPYVSLRGRMVCTVHTNVPCVSPDVEFIMFLV